MDKEKRSMLEPAKKDEGGADVKKATEDQSAGEKTHVGGNIDHNISREDFFDIMIIPRVIDILVENRENLSIMKSLPPNIKSHIEKISKDYDDTILSKDGAKEELRTAFASSEVTLDILTRFLEDNNYNAKELRMASVGKVEETSDELLHFLRDDNLNDKDSS